MSASELNAYLLQDQNSANQQNQEVNSNENGRRGAISEKMVVVDETLWNERLETIVPDRELLNQLVMNFLVVEGYKEGALAFQEESGCEAHLDKPQID